MRAIIIASLLAFTIATSDGFGNLLKGMGQEVKKAGIGNEAKKDDKKASKSGDSQSKEDKK